MASVLSVSDTTVAFDNTSSVRYVNLTAPPDTVLEYNASFVLSIQSPLPSTEEGRIMLDPDNLTITALDDPSELEQGWLGKQEAGN